LTQQKSKKRKFVADGVFYAELNEFLTRELAEEGYAGVDVRITPQRTEVIVRATQTRNVLGENGQRIRELRALIMKRFEFPPESLEIFAEKVPNRGLCAIAQAESLRYKLTGGLAVRRACYGVLRFIMEAGAKGCQVIISGKLRGQRAKAMKFKDGYMITSGDATNYYIDEAVRHCLLRQGVLGIKVTIMLSHDPHGKEGPKKNLPDIITVHEPKPVKEEPEMEPQGYGGYGGGGGGGGGYGGGRGGPPRGYQQGPPPADMGPPQGAGGYDNQQQTPGGFGGQDQRGY